MPDKISKREKLAIWLLLLCARVVMPSMTGDVEEIWKRINHELYVNS